MKRILIHREKHIKTQNKVKPAKNIRKNQESLEFQRAI